MLSIGLGNEDALVPCRTSRRADIEKPPDLLVHSANGLNLAMLIDRASDRQVLPNWQLGQGRKQSIKLGRRCAVTFNASIGLLENQTREQRHRCVERVSACQQPREDQHPFRMDRSAKL